MRPAEFLRRLWGEQTGYVFLPKKKKRWVEGRAYSTAEILELSDDELEALLDTDGDQYFSPLVFTEPRRLNDHVAEASWLYADLDAVDPRRCGLRPTIAVRSSPGRYQAYWLVDHPIVAAKFAEYNRRLSYAIGADRGGWDLSQVLRPPGTLNHKYGPSVTVRTVWDDGPVYSLRQVVQFLKGVEANSPSESAGSLVGLQVSPLTRDEILREYRGRLSARARELLSIKDVEFGERSDRLWELECRLLESGLEPGEVFVVVRDLEWNKFKERANGEQQLWAEIQKAGLHVGYSAEERSEPGGPSLRIRPRIVTYADLLGSKLEEPEWLVEDWWTLGSHGIIAGLPKSYKSLVTMDLAVSVASEAPFLGSYAVNPKGVGPVVVVQQENSLPLLRDRLVKISASKGLQTSRVTSDGKSVVVELPPAIPLMFYNDFGFDMSMQDDRDAIEEVIRREGAKLVVFDPLYLMIGGADENSAQELRPILSWLLRLRNLYQCAVVVVHHWGKGAPSRGGRGTGGVRLLGSTTLYGWLEAAVYLESTVEVAEGKASQFTVVAEREFRERMSPPPRAFNLVMGDIGDNTYRWDDGGTAGTDNRIVQAIESAGAGGATIGYLQKETEIGLKKLRRELQALLDSGTIERRTAEDGRTQRFYHGT